ncbi:MULTISPECIES: hypothetical protein [Prauserella salsuginis group]|uniref:Uncharacterized protein n=1 Tax=Prauserella salsuginis TaxID=387889 RepID=A0ABW6FWM8_9PSEU|nr:MULTISPECIES: hypothetical protein [Prauserella salsuginis group]MCR3720379.1 hypothetical protein [Prauserella flava]MCR3733912.1 hypothetical protein [Prauserella salsuginis]
MGIEQARAFLAAHGRQLDRRRFDAITGTADGHTVLAALEAYRNDDGGYGWGIEPDLRARESQPAGALHALEAMVDAEPVTTPRAAPLLDWLTSVTLADGGLPFALPIADTTGCAPFWAQAEPRESSLQITAAVAAQAHRLAAFDPDVAGHPWLARATEYCFAEIRNLDERPFAYVLSFALMLADAASDTHPEALRLLDHLATFVPTDGAVPVEGGAEGETLHLLDFAPEPGRPVRKLVSEAAVESDLDRVESERRADGGWAVDFDSYSPAAALEWRGYTTVGNVAILHRNGRL